MKRILLVTTSFPEEVAGREAAGSFVSDFALELAQRLPVTVVAPAPAASREEAGGLTIHRFAVPRLPLSLLKPYNPAHWPAIIQTLRAGNRAVREAGMTADHTLALWALPSGYWARNLHRAGGPPYAIWALGSDIWSLRNIPLVKDILRSCLTQASHRFADGIELGRDVEAICGQDCRLLPSSRLLPRRPLRRLAESPPYRLAFLGRWHPNKGVDLLMDALLRLKEDDWASIAAVRIAGGGPLAERVRQAGAALAQAGRPVTVEGYLDKEEAADLLHWAHWLLIPSRIESIPVIFSDALHSTLPVVAMPVGDLPRLVSDVGFLAQEVSAASFADALRLALATPPASFTDDLLRLAPAFSIPGAVDSLLGVLSPSPPPDEDEEDLL